MKKYTEDERGTIYNISSEEDVDRMLSRIRVIFNGKFVGNPHLINLVIPDNIVEIGEYAFQKCPNLWRVRIDGAEIVHKDAFRLCENLKIVSINPTIRRIGKRAFSNTGVVSINIPRNAKVEEYAFQNSKLQYAYIPDINNLEHGVFHSCEELNNVTILGGEVIPQWLFHGCRSLTSIKLPASITEIKNNAFTKTGLTRVEIPASTVVSESAFDPNVEIVRYERTEEHLLNIMCRNFINNKNYSNEEKRQAENLISRLLSKDHSVIDNLYEDDVK